MTLQAIVREEVATVAPGTTVDEVAARMAAEMVGSVVVVEGDRPVGVVTDRDLVVRVLGTDRDPGTATAGDVMTADPVTVDADAGLFEVTELLGTATVRRLPVVDGDALVGIVAFDDVLRLLTDELANLVRVVEAESPAY